MWSTRSTSHVRRLALIGAIGLTAVSMTAGALSGFFTACLFGEHGQACYGLGRGAVFIGWLHPMTPAWNRFGIRDAEIGDLRRWECDWHSFDQTWLPHRRLVALTPVRPTDRRRTFIMGMYDCILLPLWPIVAGSSLATMFLWLRRRRLIPGHCGACGYDLQGNVSAVCPECGSPVGAIALGGRERARRRR